MLTMNASKCYVKVRTRKFYLTDAGCGTHPIAFVDDFNNRLFEKSFRDTREAFDYAKTCKLSVWAE